MSADELVGVKILFALLKTLEIRMRKLVLGLSVTQILSEKINKRFLPKKLGFIDVLSTVGLKKLRYENMKALCVSDPKLNLTVAVKSARFAVKLIYSLQIYFVSLFVGNTGWKTEFCRLFCSLITMECFEILS